MTLEPPANFDVLKLVKCKTFKHRTDRFVDYTFFTPDPCKGLCYDYCGIISVQPIELQYMKDHIPDFVDKFDKTPRAEKWIDLYLGPAEDYNTMANRCPYLTANNKCSIYGARPIICRIWGLVNTTHPVQMRCPWGCRPDRWLTDSEVDKVLAFIKGEAATK